MLWMDQDVAEGHVGFEIRTVQNSADGLCCGSCFIATHHLIQLQSPVSTL